MASFLFSENQRVQYAEDGYLMIPSLFDAEEMSLLLDIARADKELAEQAGIMKDTAGGESRIKLWTNTQENIYGAFVQSPRIVNPMQQLIGKPVYHWHHKMMLKEPRVGGAWEWHQDYGYWYFDNVLFPDMASCMIAVDRASKENGCLQVIKGSHRMGRVHHGQTGGQTGADVKRVNAALEKLELIYCEMDPGTALFFHSNLLHRSDRNASPNPRWSLICCYNALDNAPFEGPGHGKPEPIQIADDRRIKGIGRLQRDLMKREAAAT